MAFTTILKLLCGFQGVRSSLLQFLLLIPKSVRYQSFMLVKHWKYKIKTTVNTPKTTQQPDNYEYWFVYT